MRLHPADVRLSRWYADLPTNVRFIPLMRGPSHQRAAYPFASVRTFPLQCAVHPIATCGSSRRQCAVHPVDVRLIPSTCGVIKSAVQLNEECKMPGIGVCCGEHAKPVGASSQRMEPSTQPQMETDLLEAVGVAEEA